MLLRLEGVPCRRRAIREYLAEHTEGILQKGLMMTPNDQMAIEAWKAMDDILQPPVDLVQYLRDIRSDARSWYGTKYKWLSVNMLGHLSCFPIPMGRTLDETAKIMTGCRKYLLLRIWRQEKCDELKEGT